MAEPIVFDARGGLTREILDDLRNAEQLILTLKDENTGVVGYWGPSEEATSQDGQEPHLLVVNRRRGESPQDARGMMAVGWLKAVRFPRHSAWERLLDMLRPGDVLEMQWEMGGSPVLLVRDEEGRVGTLWVATMRFFLDMTLSRRPNALIPQGPPGCNGPRDVARLG